MYNHIESGQGQTERRLRRRTKAFYEEARVDDQDSLRRFRRRWEDGPEAKLLSGLPSCPFLGYVDFEPEGCASGGGKRVGCLVHPLQNDGIDGRDCGIYDRFVCEDYLCAAHDILREDEVRIVVDAVDDSYLYGLTITNPKFVRHLFELVARRTGSWPTKAVLGNRTVIDSFGECFELLREWPYRGSDGIFGQVKVTGKLDTARRRMPADVLDVEEDPLDVLVVCLGTECDEIEKLRAARRLVGQKLEVLMRAVQNAQR